MVDWARARREAMQKLAESRRRLVAAEQALTDAQAAVKRAETAFDEANDRYADAESALDAARAERALSRQERYQARVVHERASTAVERLQRRVRDLADRLDRMPPLTPGRVPAGRRRRGVRDHGDLAAGAWRNTSETGHISPPRMTLLKPCPSYRGTDLPDHGSTARTVRRAQAGAGGTTTTIVMRTGSVPSLA